MVNDSYLENMPQTTISYLSTTRFDHCPLFMEMVSATTNHNKYFRFLNCWVENPHFMETVKRSWEKEVQGTGMSRFHQKLKRCQTLMFGLRKNLVIFSKRFGFMRNKCTKLKKTTSLTKVNLIEVSFMKLMQSTSSFSGLKTLF